jgi:hypothetical protein
MSSQYSHNSQEWPRVRILRIVRILRTGCGAQEEGMENRRTGPCIQSETRPGRNFANSANSANRFRTEKRNGRRAAGPPQRLPSPNQRDCGPGPGTEFRELCELCEPVVEEREGVVRLSWLPRGRHPCIQSPDFSDPSEARQELDRPGYLPRESREGLLYLLSIAARPQYNESRGAPTCEPDLTIRSWEGPGSVYISRIYKPSQGASFPRVASHPLRSLISV